jgi:hypothetical protein
MDREFKTLKDARKFCKFLRRIGLQILSEEFILEYDSVLNWYTVSELTSVNPKTNAREYIRIFKTTTQDEMAKWLVAWSTKGEVRVNEKERA